MKAITSNEELFSAIRKTIIQLEADGHSGDASELSNALTSSMPGEIFGELELTLSRLAKVPGLADGLKAQVVQELTAVNTALQK